MAVPEEMELDSGPTGSARIPLQGHVRTCRGARGRAVRGGRSQGSALGVPAEWSGRAVRARTATGGTRTLSGLVLRTRGCLLFAACLMLRGRMPDTFCRRAETKAERPRAEVGAASGRLAVRG